MRAWLLLVVVAVSAFMGVWALSYAVPPAVTSVLFAAHIVGTGLAVNLLASHRRRERRADRPDSVERECAAAAAWTTLPVSLVALAAVGAWLAFTQAWVATAVAYGALVLVLVKYWLAYAHARGRS